MISLLLTGGLLLLFITAALAPLESLQWWAGWGGSESPLDDSTAATQDAAPAVNADFFMIYLSGIGAMSGTSYPEEEVSFLEQLQATLPRSVLISDVFPYSVTNMGMTGERMFATLWRRIEALRLKNPYALSIGLLNLRNMFQVATSVDQRYGPIYNVGIAKELRRTLIRHGYQNTTPIVLLGYSGGGQVSLGVTLYLARMCRAPIWVVSIGGVMGGDPGLLHLEHLWHIYGSKDPIQASGKYVFGGRWPINTRSTWNQALRAGKITMVPMGPFKHLGIGGYFDAKTISPEGMTYREKTISTIVDLFGSVGLVQPSAPGAALAVDQPPASV